MTSLVAFAEMLEFPPENIALSGLLTNKGNPDEESEAVVFAFNVEAQPDTDPQPAVANDFARPLAIRMAWTDERLRFEVELPVPAIPQDKAGLEQVTEYVTGIDLECDERLSIVHLGEDTEPKERLCTVLSSALPFRSEWFLDPLKLEVLGQVVSYHIEQFVDDAYAATAMLTDLMNSDIIRECSPRAENAYAR